MWRTVWGNLSASGAREAIVTPEYGPGYFTGQSCVTKEWSPEALWAQTLAASAHLREEFAAWEAQLAEGNAITAEAHKARGNKVHESIARSAAKAKL